jgi:hypothetical protein
VSRLRPEDSRDRVDDDADTRHVLEIGMYDRITAHRHRGQLFPWVHPYASTHTPSPNSRGIDGGIAASVFVRPMPAVTSNDDRGRARCFTSAGLGALAWLATPWLGVGSPPELGTLEHVFLFMPLVAAPLAIVLASSLLGLRGDDAPLLYRLARRLQPSAAWLLLASFCVASYRPARSLLR